MEKKTGTFYIKRSSEGGKDPRWVEYKVPMEEHMTILGVLDYIYENIDSSLSYYQSCRFGRCKGCFVVIDEKNAVLSCDEVAVDGMRIGPLESFEVIKDLVFDFDKPMRKGKGGKND